MSLLGKIIGKGKSPLESVADVVDRFVDTKEDKREFFKEVYQMQAADRANARQLYGQDALVQKVYAITFLLGYLGLTAWLLYSIVSGNIKDVNQFETGMIGTIWGAMSAKVNTVVDFFFGSSDQKSNTNHDQLIGK
jgi:regulator of sigma D